MRNIHHTKTKADVGLVKVIADLTEKGYVPCIPLSEHQPFDLLAVIGKGSMISIQVKYAQLQKDGTIDVKFRSSWADKHGTHVIGYNEDDFDYYAIYCPEKKIVLYIPNTFDCPKKIRFNPTKNNQHKNVNWYQSYLSIKREPSETIRRTPEMVKT